MKGAAMHNDPTRRWLDYISGLTWRRGQLDEASHLAFLRAGSLGIDPQQAFDQVAHRIREAGDFPKPGKLRRQLRRDYEWVRNPVKVKSGKFDTAIAKATFNAPLAENLAGRAKHVSAEWVRRRSPIPVSAITPAEFLAALYPRGERVVVLIGERDRGAIWSDDRIPFERLTLNRYIRGCRNPLFLPNPVDGLEHVNSDGNLSLRSEPNITAFRYAVLESDLMPAAQWLKIVVQLPLPIVSLTYSGGSSIHGLVRVGTKDKQGWDEVVRQRLLPNLVALGACRGSLTAVRLTRLPNCRRDETGKLQELLYLNPHACGEPIWKGA
jgi:hypothetical protein